MNTDVRYLADDTVDPGMDAELRELLSTCFTKPQDVVFRTQRYFRDPYPHRWVVCDGRGALVAHAGVHEKAVVVESAVLPIGGIGDLCVHPDWRGRGLVNAMLRDVHAWLRERRYLFAVLFGDLRVYRSSGYRQVCNLVHLADDGQWRTATALVCELAGRPWPNETVRLQGHTF